MAVLTSSQGRGVATQILSFTEEVSKQNSFHLLMMHARNPVIDFY